MQDLAMRGLIKRNHFIWLTLALIGLMLTGAFSREVADNLTLQLIEYTSVSLLLLSLLSLKTDHYWGKGFLIIVGIMLAVVVVRGATEIGYFEYFYLGLMLTFMLAAAWLVGSQVLLTGTVDLNIIVGSVALYLLIGLIWSIFYTILLEFAPDAINGIDAGMWYDNYPLMTYFSFVTLTTLGYGDMSPSTPVAQVMVILEAVTGMFYLAVIVASLIGGRRNRA
jgi:voltage-gated potassium channel